MVKAASARTNTERHMCFTLLGSGGDAATPLFLLPRVLSLVWSGKDKGVIGEGGGGADVQRVSIVTLKNVCLVSISMCSCSVAGFGGYYA